MHVVFKWCLQLQRPTFKIYCRVFMVEVIAFNFQRCCYDFDACEPLYRAEYLRIVIQV